jgi:hypothetical protein
MRFQVLTAVGMKMRVFWDISIVSGYGLDDRAIGVRSPAGAKDFSSILCVQTGSTSLLYNGYRGSFPRG